MAKALKDIETDALQLPMEQRADLAKALLLSLEEPNEAEIEMIWAAEAQRRYEEIERGEVEARPFDEVLRELRERRR